VNVTVEPEQVGFEPVVIAAETEGITVVFTVIAIALLVTIPGLAHVAVEVITTSIDSPLVSVVLE
jgi:uncharacterized membrane protein